MATGSTSRVLLLEAVTFSNDLESYATHFVLLAEIQHWKRTEKDPTRQFDEWPRLHFAKKLGHIDLSHFNASYKRKIGLLR